MMDYYSKAQRSAYNKRYREKHKKHLNWCMQLYRSRVREWSRIDFREIARK